MRYTPPRSRAATAHRRLRMAGTGPRPRGDRGQQYTSRPGGGAAAVLLASGVLLVVWGLLGLRYRPLRHLEDVVPDAAPPPESAADLDAIQAKVLNG
ncbi:hypothetical protein ACIBQ1_19840 [Nonomuraea sp. NPDC050153]|uniref:hypothetical protein n=1 Tax=Nonomuraea sp. NPDC050153 TaxID=3364359 RepID=UPI0037B5379F